MPEATTAVDWVVTGAPLPAGGVMVTVTLVLAMVPEGKLFPVKTTVVPTVAGVVTGLRMTWALAVEARPHNARAPAIATI